MGEKEYEGTHPSNLLKQPSRSLTAVEGSGLHPEVLSGKEQIELLEIQNYSKIPGFLGDNENWRQTKIRNIVYLNDCILRNQIAYLLLDAKDHLRILRGHGDFPYDTRKMALNRKLETISHNRKNKGIECDC